MEQHAFGNKHTLPFIVSTCAGFRGSGHLAEADIRHHRRAPGGIHGESNGILMICSLYCRGWQKGLAPAPKVNLLTLVSLCKNAFKSQNLI